MPDGEQNERDIALTREQHEGDVVGHVWASKGTAASVGQIITAARIEGAFPHTTITVDWYWKSGPEHSHAEEFPLYHLEDGPDPNSDSYRPYSRKFSAGDKRWDAHDIIDFIMD